MPFSNGRMKQELGYVMLQVRGLQLRQELQGGWEM